MSAKSLSMPIDVQQFATHETSGELLGRKMLTDIGEQLNTAEFGSIQFNTI